MHKCWSWVTIRLMTHLSARKWLVGMAAGLLLLGSVACGQTVSGKGQPESQVGTFKQQLDANVAAASLPAAPVTGPANDPEPTPTPIGKGLPNPNLPNNNPALPTPTPVPAGPKSPTTPNIVIPTSGDVDQAAIPALLAQAMNLGQLSASTMATQAPAGNEVDQGAIPSLVAGSIAKSGAIGSSQGAPAANPVDQAALPSLIGNATLGAKGGVPQAAAGGVAAPNGQAAQALGMSTDAAISGAPAMASCQSFTTQRARNWCSNPSSESLLTCADFPAGTGEATRFTQQRDPDDTNGLDKDGDGRSCSDR